MNLINSDGIFSKSNQAVYEHNIKVEMERLEVIKFETIMDNKGKITVDLFIKELIKRGITTKEDVVDNGDGSKSLVTDTGYRVKVKPVANNDIKIEIEIETGTGTEITAELILGDVKWSNGKASITVEKTSGDYNIEYKINTGSYSEIQDGQAIGDLNLEDTVTVRLVKGTNELRSKSITIQDVVKPNLSNISLSSNICTTGSSITATVKQSDDQSGIDIDSCKYAFVQQEEISDESLYSGFFESIEDEVILSATNSGTYYLHIISVDKAGNITETRSEAVNVTQAVTDVSLNETSLVLGVGETAKLIATVNPSDSINKNVTWSTSDSSIVSVNNEGDITAVGVGTAIITVATEDGNKTATCVVNVSLTLGGIYNDNMIGQSLTYSANGQKQWIVLGRDLEKEGNILITTMSPVANGMELYGSAEKWLSYEDDLDAACSVYGGKIGDTTVEARSISIKDINNVTGFKEPKFTEYTFGKTMSFGTNKVNFLYPKEGASFKDIIGNVYKDWKAPTESDEKKFEENWYYYNDIAYLYDAGNFATNGMVNAEIGDLIWGTSDNYFYLIASRALNISAENAIFNVGMVNEGMVMSGYGYFCYSSASLCMNHGSDGVKAIRPVVSLPGKLPVKENGGKYDLVY